MNGFSHLKITKKHNEGHSIQGENCDQTRENEESINKYLDGYYVLCPDTQAWDKVSRPNQKTKADFFC